jgi:hypothetical protein
VGDHLPRIDWRAVVIAFAAEFVADLVISSLLFSLFAGDRITPDMTDAQFLEVRRAVLDTTSCLAWLVLFGSATTVGGGYLAARLAKRIPYYHGLAMGIAGVIDVVVEWNSEFTGLAWLGIVTTIPLALCGAHLAKRHLEAA